MAARLAHPPIPASHLLKKQPRFKITLSATAPRSNYSGFTHSLFIFSRSEHSHGLLRVRAAAAAASEEQISGLLEDPNDAIALTKSSIYHALEGINRGVFGVTSVKRREIEDLVKKLEAQNPTPNPILNLEKIIDVTKGKAVNVIKFSARGLSLLNGQLTIQASFTVASSSKVNIKYDNSQITPDQLMNLLKKNYELLLSIFNPEGWLDITYVDETMRIGRDDKGNIFLLERSTDQQ